MITGIVIVTWNSAGVIDACLSACERIPGTRVMVVDNASSDDTVAVVRRRPAVELFASEVNLGFAGGVNAGMKRLEGCEAVLLLNPDAIPVTGIGKLADAVMQPGVGAAAGTLTGSDGRPQDGFNVRRLPTPLTLAFEVLGMNRLMPWNPVNRRYRVVAHRGTTQDVEQPAAAFLMVNRRAWQAVGGFDEGFHPVWFEDVDFCFRLRERGYRIVYVPAAEARHLGGHSAARLDWDTRQVFWYGSLLRYASLRFSRTGCATVACAVMAASVPRAVAGAAVHGVQRSVRVYAEIFRRALACWNQGAGRADCTADNRHEREGETANFRKE